MGVLNKASQFYIQHIDHQTFFCNTYQHTVFILENFLPVKKFYSTNFQLLNVCFWKHYILNSK